MAPGSDGGWAFLVLLFAPIAACVVGVEGSWSNILAAEVTEDGHSLKLRKPTASFVMSLPSLGNGVPAPPPGWVTTTPS